jgi:hypothetical protein
MSNMVLQCKESGDFKPHPEGIHPAVCVDVMDLGLTESEYQGKKRMVNKVKLVFESEQMTDDGKRCTVARNFTASLHKKSKLAEFLGKWRGRPVLPPEKVHLAKLLGESCTLVVSHQQNLNGKTYASIDAVSKPMRKLAPSGHYDPAVARQRYAEWLARQAQPVPNAESGTGNEKVADGTSAVAVTQGNVADETPAAAQGNVPGGPPSTAREPRALPRSSAPQGAADEDNVPFDCEVGF